MHRVNVRPELLRWARERAGREVGDLVGRFPWLPASERGERQPTRRQLEDFAKATCAPLGYLFLPSPPEEQLPIGDFRTVHGEVRRPSPDLLDTIYTMQRRQAWLREDRIEYDVEPLHFVGSARLTDNPAGVGQEMRRTVGLGPEWAGEVASWTEAVGALRGAIERTGVMAIINGIVGNNTHRTLSVDEFRGFALCDSHAPLIFVNGADAKSAQMFTLAHELAHLWLGPAGEGLSAFDNISPGGTEVESFCDRAAAEFLLPARELQDCWDEVKRDGKPFLTLARRFKVSPIVAGRRAMDLRLVGRETFFTFYRVYVNQERGRTQGAGGGDFYNNQTSRVGRMFAEQVILAAREGRLSFAVAYDLVGLRGWSFQEYAKRLGLDTP